MTPGPFGSVAPQDLLALFAAATQPGGDLTALINLGAIGVVAAILIAWARTVVKRDADRSEAVYKRDAERAEAAYRREVERADRLEAALTSVHADVQDKVIPTMLASASALKECTELLRDLQRDRRTGYDQPRTDGRR